MNTSWLLRGVQKLIKEKHCGAVIVAAGSASRMEGIDKILAKLGGEPVIQRTVRVFAACSDVQEIVVVTRPDRIQEITDLCSEFPKVRAVIAGGASRQESVNMGLAALSDQVTMCAIHDGARPLITEAVISRTIRAAEKYGAAIPAIPVKDTIKTEKGGFVGSTPDRSTLCSVQTPQVFDYDLLRGALKKAAQDGTAVTDDSSAVELMGMSVKLVEGDERNIKITTPLDLRIAEILLEDGK